MYLVHKRHTSQLNSYKVGEFETLEDTARYLTDSDPTGQFEEFEKNLIFLRLELSEDGIGAFYSVNNPDTVILIEER